LYNPTGAVRDLIKLVDATSDPIESFFGMHDLVVSTLSKNTSFHVTSAVATWRHNHTTAFLQTLSAVQLDELLHAAVKKGRVLKREADMREKEAAAHKLRYLKVQAEKTRQSEKKMIKELLRLQNEHLFKTTVQYESYKTSISNNYKTLLKELKKQIRLLRKV